MHSHPDLEALLDVEQLELNLFRGDSVDVGSHSVFGGQVLGQSVMAAARTVEGRALHSMHAYFLRAGDVDAPIVYDVERARDGNSFSTRRVVAIQHGRPIFNASMSFHTREEGIEHHASMPSVPSPESLSNSGVEMSDMLSRLPETIRAWYQQRRPFDLLEVPTERRPEDGPRMHCVWMRPTAPIRGSREVHQALLAYISDFNLLHAALWPHVLTYGLPDLLVASLDHAMWFHGEVRLDDWLLYVTDSPNAGEGRAFCRGSFYNRAGKLLATTAQEGLVRRLPGGTAR